MAYKLEFNFTGSWVEYEAAIDDLTKTEVLYKDLKPADSTVSCTLTPDTALYNLLRGIGTSRIPARLYDGAAVIFTGYLRSNFQINKKQRLQPVKLELVTASFLLKRKVWQNIGYTSINVSTLLGHLLTSAGVTLYTLPTIAYTIPAFYVIAGEGETYHAYIERILYEYGYVGYFDETGRFITHKLDPASVVTAQAFDGSNL